MDNFDFAKPLLPTVYADCARAESYMASDPRSACFYSRRAVEHLVSYLYDVLGLEVPYKSDLAARTHDPAFKAVVGHSIGQKLTLLRKLGNGAVHEEQPVSTQASLQALKDLHHVVVWATFHHSTNPEAAPTGAAFDPALAAQAAPLTRSEVTELSQKFEQQDAKYAADLQAKDELLAAHQAQIEELKQQIEAAQESNTQQDDRDYDEAETRDLFIDVLLREAGWPLADARDREYPVTGMPNQPGTGFVDYVLWGADGRPLAVVEAKRTRKSPQVGQQQAKLYADCLEAQFGRQPMIFYTNGYEHWLWDDAAGYPPREVQGFYTRDELELMIQRRQSRATLSGAGVNTNIAGRPYQVRAIQAVGQAFDGKQREALLAMATGSGKTRTVIALVDQLMKANWAKRVLFLADRTALVNQAANAFKAQLPDATTVNLVTEKTTDGRVYVSTHPTMMNLINEVDDAGRRFGPGYFDLIIIDEAHRSVYAKYGQIFEYFDALLVGLTATPKDEVDHNTYRLFHLEDGVPTDAYSLDEAVADGYLVPPKGVAVDTQFLRDGIKYEDLSDEEKDQWDTLEWGEDGPPDEVGAADLNQFLFNEDTVDKVLATLMTDGHKVASGDRIGKTIIFAKSQAHAAFIAKRFDIQYPGLGGQYARVITHSTAYAQSLIDDFSITEKPPHIAISVDMLDTGIDVPDVVNLVFFKMVRSKSKFWQMIGRGTRLRPDLFGPDLDKRDFYVFDFCGNLQFFGQDLPGSEGSTQKSLTQRIFEARVGLITGLDDADTAAELRASAANELHAVVAGMNLDNFVVRPHRKAVERFADAAAWESFSDEAATEALGLSGLPSAAAGSREQAKRFDLMILSAQLATLSGDAKTVERIRKSIQLMATNLLGKTAIPQVKKQAELLEDVAGDLWWIDVTLPMLELARLRLRGLMEFVDKTTRNPVYTDFEDTLGEAVAVDLPGIAPGTDMERFRAKAAAYLKEHQNHVALQRLRRNKQLTAGDLSALEAMLLTAGIAHGADLARASGDSGGLGLFIRSLVGLDRSAAVEVFETYLDDTRFTVDQVRFVNLIVDELTANGVMEPQRLFESPYTDSAPTGPEVFFPPADVTVIVDILGEVRSRAMPADVA